MLRLISRRAAREQRPAARHRDRRGRDRQDRPRPRALRRAAARTGWRTVVGRSPPYGHGIAFWALGEILHDAAGALDRRAARTQVEPALRRVLEEVGADDAAELAAALVVAMRGADEGADAEDELKRAWRRFVALLAADRPLAIGVDDAHWADEGTLNLLEEAAFGLSRGAGHDPLHQPTRARRATARLRPRRAQPHAARAAAARWRLGDAPGGAAPARMTGARSRAGSPTPRAATRSSPRRSRARSARTAARPCPSVSPTPCRRRSPRASTCCRRRRSAPSRYAAVLGHTFAQGPLEDLLGEDRRPISSGRCAERALVEERDDLGRGHYAFRHQLIRDVAYRSLPRGRAGRPCTSARPTALGRASRSPSAPSWSPTTSTTRSSSQPTAERRAAACARSLEAAASAVRRGAAARGQELYEQAAELVGRRRARSTRCRRRRGRAPPLARRPRHAALPRGGRGRRARRRPAVPPRRTPGRSRSARGWAGSAATPTPTRARPMLDRGRELVADDDLVTQARLLLDEAWIAWRNDQTERDGASPRREDSSWPRRPATVTVLQSALDAITASDWHAGPASRRGRAHEGAARAAQRDAPRTATLDVERSDALHMMIESPAPDRRLPRGRVRTPTRHADLDLSRGDHLLRLAARAAARLLPGRLGRGARHGERVRDAWVAAERPPLGAFATSIACAGRSGAPRRRRRSGLVRDRRRALAGRPRQQGRRDRDAGRHRAAPGRRSSAPPTASSRTISTTWFRSPYLAGRAEAFARLGRKDADDAIAAAEEGDRRAPLRARHPAPRQGNSRRRRGHPRGESFDSSRRSTARTRRRVPAG